MCRLGDSRVYEEMQLAVKAVVFLIVEMVVWRGKIACFGQR